MLKIAICDDDEFFINNVVKILSNYKKNENSNIIFKTYKNGFNLLNDIEKFNLILLDVEMPQINGFDVAKEIRHKDIDCEIIFLTSAKEKGYKGFEVNAKNYLIKPIKYSTLSEVISKEIEDNHKKKSETIIFTINSNKLKQIKISDLLYVEAKGKKCLVKCENDEFEIIEKLKNIKVKLEKYEILNPHRSYLVNSWKIKDYNNRDIIMKDGSAIPLSRRKFKEFKEKYYNFLLLMRK